jgi:hypothetical protein
MSLAKRAGSRADSLRNGSEDPDPFQNVTEPEHWFELFLWTRSILHHIWNGQF